MSKSALYLYAGVFLVGLGSLSTHYRTITLEKRIAALEQMVGVPKAITASTTLPPSCIIGQVLEVAGKMYLCEKPWDSTWLPQKCSPPATFEDDGKLYECVAKDTWRLKERK